MPSKPRTDLQRALATLTDRAAADVRKLIASGASPDKVADLLRKLMPALIDKYGTAAAAVAADWYEEQRIAAGVAGSFRVEPKDAVERLPDGKADGIVGAGSAHLFGDEPNPTLAADIISGAMSTQILNTARETIMDSAIADPASAGWSRETDRWILE